MEESPPGLRLADQVLGPAGLADLDAEFEQMSSGTSFETLGRPGRP